MFAQIKSDKFNLTFFYFTGVTAPTATASRHGALSQAQQAAPLPQQQTGQNTILTVGARTFVYNQEVWTDTAYDPQKMPTLKVAFLSPDYFRLSQSRTDVAAALALGSRVIVVVDGAAYEVIAENGVVPTVSVLPVAPAATATAPKPATLATSPLPTLESPRSADWLPVAVIGLAALAAFGISWGAWMRRKG